MEFFASAIGPIPFSTFANREWGEIGKNYLKSLFALGFQGFLIMVCKPITADFRKQLTDAVVEGYGAAIEKMQATLDAAKGAQKKPSAIGALRESAGRVQAQPAGPASNRNDPAL